jgi:tryptophan 2,3-dioxygenase
MAASEFDVPYGEDKTEYEHYLRVRELLALQKPSASMTHPDELLFQVVHQVEELWMKLMIHELGAAVSHLEGDRHVEARGALDRVGAVGELMERQLRLFETMLPGAFLTVRKGLGTGSGMDSPGFKRLHEMAPRVWDAFELALTRAGVELLELHARSPSPHAALLAVAEGLVNCDAQMQRFKREHVMIVRRIIGMGTASLRGNPIELLERNAQLTWFPMLWAVRDRMFTDFRAGPPVPAARATAASAAEVEGA